MNSIMTWINSFNISWILWVLGFIVAVYIALVVFSILTKGWSSLATIWFYTKKFGLFFVILIGLYFALRALQKKGGEKASIDSNLAKVQNLENKTQVDSQREAVLVAKKKQVEQDIVDLTKKYQEKVDALNAKPPDKPTDPPGHAGQSYEDLKKNW